MTCITRVASLGGAVALMGVAALLPGGRAAADSAYTATTEAGGLRVIVQNQSIPLSIAPEVSGPVAIAIQNSLQQSDALASMPYPGDAVANAPSTVAGSANLPLPSYPFVVTTSLGDTPAHVSYPGIDLRAESAQTLTQASATGGTDAIGSSSTARVLHDGDVVTANAVTDANVIRIGDDLVISGLHAAAMASRDAAGALTRASTLAFSSLSASGLAFTLPPPPGTNGPSTRVTPPAISLVDGKFRVLAPGQPENNTEVPAADVVAALTKAGYPTTYEQARQTANGIIGAGLQINTTVPAPPPGLPGGVSGESPVVLALGLVKAEISYAGAPTTPTIGTGGTAAGVPTASTPTATTPTTPGILPPGAPGSPFASFSVPAGAFGNPPAVHSPLPTVDFTTLAAASTGNEQPDVAWIYSLVAAVGLAALAGTVVLAYRGVR